MNCQIPTALRKHFPITLRVMAQFFQPLQAQNTKCLADCLYLIQSSVQHCIPMGYTQRGGKPTCVLINIIILYSQQQSLWRWSCVFIFYVL